MRTRELSQNLHNSEIRVLISTYAYFCCRLILFVSLGFGIPRSHVRQALSLFGASPDPRFDITVDRSFGEVYGYTKFALSALLCIAIARSAKSGLFIALAVILLVMLFDDSLSVHEKVGDFFEHRLELTSWLGLRGQDFGELLFGAIAGTVVLVLILVSWKAETPYMQGRALITMALIGVFLFFAVVMDMLHSLIAGIVSHLNGELGLIEDGGELIALTFLVAFLARLAKENAQVTSEAQ